MKKITNLEDALKRISELEEENSKLKEELEYYPTKKHPKIIDHKL